MNEPRKYSTEDVIKALHAIRDEVKAQRPPQPGTAAVVISSIGRVLLVLFFLGFLFQFVALVDLGDATPTDFLALIAGLLLLQTAISFSTMRVKGR